MINNDPLIGVRGVNIEKSHLMQIEKQASYGHSKAREKNNNNNNSVLGRKLNNYQDLPMVEPWDRSMMPVREDTVQPEDKRSIQMSDEDEMARDLDQQSLKSFHEDNNTV